MEPISTCFVFKFKKPQEIQYIPYRENRYGKPGGWGNRDDGYGWIEEYGSNILLGSLVDNRRDDQLNWKEGENLLF